jgi:hypothetical protein
VRRTVPGKGGDAAGRGTGSHMAAMSNLGGASRERIRNPDHNGDVDGDMENASHLVSSRAMAAAPRRPKLLLRLRDSTTRPSLCFLIGHVEEQQ